MKRLETLGSVGVLLLGLAACGGKVGDGGDGSAGSSGNGGAAGSVTPPITIDSGLPPNAIVGDLTPDQVAQLCGAMADSATQLQQDPTVVRGACLGAAYVSAGASLDLMGEGTGGSSSTDVAALRSSCQQAYDACMLSSTTPLADPQCDQPSSACRATVDTLQTCYADTGNAVVGVLGGLVPCEEMSESSFMTMLLLAATYQPTPACELLTQQCPELSPMTSLTSTDTTLPIGGGTTSGAAGDPAVGGGDAGASTGTATGSTGVAGTSAL